MTEISQPVHYADVVPGIECIDVVQWFNFNRGNVIKYVWRADHKDGALADLKKARQYLDFEIARLEAEQDATAMQKGIRSMFEHMRADVDAFAEDAVAVDAIADNVRFCSAWCPKGCPCGGGEGGRGA